ncbi:MAG: hypothetical protein A2099_08015 [Planctomycetes bacterium GWF2_39_10]|nr:MAG: hypothetical protein A2Y09_11360 [Planctomycetes bacterium GWA2_39_15]OHB46210.1 MAG: hypothetical protein A2099_08015 [Planctomycetes bacterium GWF2_39_10]
MVEIANEMDLTNPELILYFLQCESEERMQGTIRAKGHCPVCRNKFIEIKRFGYICSAHKTVPKRFFVDLFYKGLRIRVFSDKQGQPIDTYQRASDLLNHINYEIKNYSFDPTKYVKQQLVKYYVANLLEKFLESKIETLAPSYKKDYMRYTRIAQSFFGAMDVRELRKLDLINYKEHLERDFEFSDKTVKNIFDNFKTFLRYLRNDIEIVDTIPSFPIVETTQPETHWLSADVQQKAIECIPEEDKPIIAFLMLHGCRPGEARALKCKDVSLDKGTITISATFSNEVYREKRKGRNVKDVTIPIHLEMFEFIKGRVGNNLPGAFVFINSVTGRNYSEGKLSKIWEKVREEIGLSKSIRLYDATRHSVASQLVNKGVPILSVSRLLGHSNTKMTERYAHVDLEKLKYDMKNLSLKGETVTKLSPEAKTIL